MFPSNALNVDACLSVRRDVHARSGLNILIVEREYVHGETVDLYIL